MLDVIGLSCGYRQREVVHGASFSLRGGELLCLLGPNGAGKTTLFKTLLGLLPARAGEVRIEGQSIAAWPRRRLAQWIGYVPQAHTPPFPFLVRDVVAMGRTAHLGWRVQPRASDRQAAEQAMAALGITALATARITEISGGERQLVLIARALAQQPRLLVMDEPTSNLDYGNQLRVMAHVRRIVDELRLGVILTTHHPEHALRYATQVLALDRSGHARSGVPREIVTAGYLRETYGVEAEVLDVALTDGRRSPCCIPLDAAVVPPVTG